MSFRLQCTECQKSLNAPDSALGKRIRCPACGATFLAQDEPPEDEAEEEVFEERGAERRSKLWRSRKNSGKRWLTGLLAGVAAVLFLVCGGIGWMGYRFGTGYIADSDWRTFAPADGRCSVSMPSEPRTTTETPHGVVLTKHAVNKILARSEFILLYFDLPLGRLPAGTIDQMIDEEVKSLQSKLGGTVKEKRTIALGRHPGREVLVELSGGRNMIVRVYTVGRTGQSRVYELVASGPRMDVNNGVGEKFFNSFALTDEPASRPALGNAPLVPGPKPGPQPPPSGSPPPKRKRDPAEPKTIPDLLGHWSFDESNGGQVADDSGKGGRGIAHGGRRVEGVKGKALCLDGKSDYFDFGTSPRFNFADRQPFTISGWYRTRSPEGQIVSMRQRGDGSPVIAIWISGGRLHALVRQDGNENGQYARVEARANSADDQWHHFTLMRSDQATIELFSDGQSVGRSKAAHAGGAITTNLRTVGVERYHLLTKKSPPLHFSGCIDEFCIFGRALTAEEIAALARR